MMNRILLLYILFPMFSTAQTAINPLKVGENFNYNVGDIFVYRFVELVPFQGTNSVVMDTSFIKKVITQKKVTQNSIVYIFEESQKRKSSNYIIKSIGKDSISNLKSNIFTTFEKETSDNRVDSMYITNDFNSGIINDYFLDRYPGTNYHYIIHKKFMKGLGLVFDLYDDSAPNLPIIHKTHIRDKTLVYFKKNNIEWGEKIDFSSSIDVEYTPMAIEGAHWFYEGSLSIDAPLFSDRAFCFEIKGDSLLNQKKYKKLYLQNFYFDNVKKIIPIPYISEGKYLIGLMRDDTINERVYYIGIEDVVYGLNTKTCSKNVNEEVLLFDFKVQKGDTLKWCGLRKYGSKSIVEQKDAVYLFSKNRTYIKPDRQFPFNDLSKIVAGVGYIGGGLFPKNPYSFIGNTNYCIGNDINCNILATKRIEEKQEKFSFWVNQNLYILPYRKEEYRKENYKITIYNNLGQIINSQTIEDLENQPIFDINAKGLTFAVLFQNGKPIGNTKMLIYQE